LRTGFCLADDCIAIRNARAHSSLLLLLLPLPLLLPLLTTYNDISISD
jgi:hypothetical protein